MSRPTRANPERSRDASQASGVAVARARRLQSGSPAGASAFARELRGALAIAVFLGLAAPSLQACIVTTSPTFTDQPSCPPAFVASEATPAVNLPVVIDPTLTSPSFEASVPLRTCALTKRFQVNTFLDGVVTAGTSDPTGGEERPTTVRQSFLGVAPGCHLVEVFASTAFDPPNSRNPATAGDVAYVWWYVSVPNADGSHADLSLCRGPTP